MKNERYAKGKRIDKTSSKILSAGFRSKKENENGLNQLFDRKVEPTLKLIADLIWMFWIFEKKEKKKKNEFEFEFEFANSKFGIDGIV